MSHLLEEGEVLFVSSVGKGKDHWQNRLAGDPEHPLLFYEDKKGDMDHVDGKREMIKKQTMNLKKSLLKRIKAKKAMEQSKEKNGERKEVPQQKAAECNAVNATAVTDEAIVPKRVSAYGKVKCKLPLLYPDGSNTMAISSYFIPSKSCYVNGAIPSNASAQHPVSGSLWEEALHSWKRSIPFNPTEKTKQLPEQESQAEFSREPFIINTEVKKKVFRFIPAHSRYNSGTSCTGPSSNATSRDNYTREYTVSNSWGSATDEVLQSEAAFWEELQEQSRRERNRKRNERRRIQRELERKEKAKKKKERKRELEERMRDFEERVKRVSVKRPEVEESSSQTEEEGEEEERKKLRRVAHLWRKEERGMNKGPLEEGEKSVEERKEEFFGRNGFDLALLSPSQVAFLQALDRRHEEKYQVYHGLKEPTPLFLSSMREEMMKMMNKKRKSDVMKSQPDEDETVAKEENETPVESESEENDVSSNPQENEATSNQQENPWTTAEKHRKNYELLQQRRRVVIPFQSSPSEIHHKYFPPTEYLQYHFVIDLASQDHRQDDPIAEGDAEKRSTANYGVQQGSEVHIEGYVVWREKRRRRETAQEKEKKLPLLLRNKLERCRYEKLQSDIRLQRATDEIAKLEKLVATTEEQLQNDMNRHNTLVANIHKRIDENNRRVLEGV